MLPKTDLSFYWYQTAQTVISKYMVIDADGLDIQITTTESDSDNGSVPALYANIPIKDIRNND